MADTTPPLPAGFQLDESGATPPLPAGFQVDTPAQARPAAPAQMSLADQAKRSFGMAARNVGTGLASIPDIIQAPYAATVNKAESLLGVPEKYRAATYNELAQAGLTKAGLPQYEPRSAAERYAGAGERAVAAAMGGGPVSSLLKSAPGAITRAVGETLAANPSAQLRATVAGSAAGQTAKEAKLPVAAQIAAEFAGGAAGGAAGLRTSSPELVEDVAKSVGKMNATERATLTAAMKEGYVVPPSSVATGSKIGSLMEGAGGKAKVEQMARLKNQQVTDTLAAKALGIDPKKGLNASTLEASRQPAYRAYQAVQDLPTPFTLHQDFKNRIGQIGAELEDTARKYPGIVNVDDVKKLKAQLTQGNTMMPKDAVTLIKQLRADASATLQRAYSAEKPSAEQLNLGNAQKSAANAIEKMIATNLKKTGSVQLYQDFENARRHLAKSYDVESALNTSNSHVNPDVLARIHAKSGGSKMTGELKTIADFTSAFPKASGKTETIGGVPLYSPWETALAAGTGLATHDPYYTAATLARPALRYGALSPPIQKRLVPNP